MLDAPQSDQSLPSAAAAQAPKPLDCRDRLPVIQSEIRECWEEIKKGSNEAGWNYHGDSKYNLCVIDEHALIKSIILKNPKQKIFNVLDIGAGNFSFGRTLADS